MILVLFIFGSMTQAQRLPTNWQKKAGRAYSAKNGWVVSIAKGEATEYSKTKKMAKDSAEAMANRLLKDKLKLDTLENLVYETLNEDNTFNEPANKYVYFIAIRAKNYLSDAKKKSPED